LLCEGLWRLIGRVLLAILQITDCFFVELSLYKHQIALDDGPVQYLQLIETVMTPEKPGIE
jgi:hypothetical protein